MTAAADKGKTAAADKGKKASREQPEKAQPAPGSRIADKQSDNSKKVTGQDKYVAFLRINWHFSQFSFVTACPQVSNGEDERQKARRADQRWSI